MRVGREKEKWVKEACLPPTSQRHLGGGTQCPLARKFVAIVLWNDKVITGLCFSLKAKLK